jgi:hypothetical protein
LGQKEYYFWKTVDLFFHKKRVRMTLSEGLGSAGPEILRALGENKIPDLNIDTTIAIMNIYVKNVLQITFKYIQTQ